MSRLLCDLTFYLPVYIEWLNHHVQRSEAWFFIRLMVKIIMSRAIKREPNSPICLEKLSFFGCWESLSAASKCRKTHPCDYRISKFSRGACPRTPLGGKALWALPILCQGVKLSCPPVQNLNEPPGYHFSFHYLKTMWKHSINYWNFYGILLIFDYYCFLYIGWIYHQLVYNCLT